MSYCAPEAFIGIFGERETINLSNLDEPTATTVNTARLQQALDDASEEIDTYLQERYDLTQLRADPPRRLVRICADIARYTLAKNRPPEDYRQRYEDAIAWLKDVAKGIASLGLTSTEQVVPESSLPIYRPGLRVFTRDSLAGY
jgi:phage gp36-like protein